MAVSLTPGSNDELRITMDGETIFDKRAEGNIHPELRRVKAMRALIRRRLQAAGVAPD